MKKHQRRALQLISRTSCLYYYSPGLLQKDCSVFYSIRVSYSASWIGFETEECANILFESGKLYCTIHIMGFPIFFAPARIFLLCLLYLFYIYSIDYAYSGCFFISFTVCINKNRIFFIKIYIYPIDIFGYSVIIKRKPMEKS